MFLLLHPFILVRDTWYRINTIQNVFLQRRFHGLCEMQGGGRGRMRRKASSKENIPVQATSFTGQFASFASGLGGNFLDHPLSGLAGLPSPLI